MRISKVAALAGLLALVGASCTQKGAAPIDSQPEPKATKSVTVSDIALPATGLPAPIEPVRRRGDG